MTAEQQIETQHLPLGLSLGLGDGARPFWDAAVQRIAAWMQARGVQSRDAVVLLPFAQHLASARRAWRGTGLWQPRMETSHSLASALGPSPLSQGLQISFDAAIDVLNARQLLAGQSWAEDLRRQDARAWQLALQHLVEAAQAFARQAQTLGPEGRQAFWPRARLALQQGGPADLERALALVALEWAASDSRVPASDALFRLRPSAWVLMRAGGSDSLCDALLAQAAAQDIPCLLLDADCTLEQLAADLPPARLQEARCEDSESLAQCTAATVLEHLRRQETPVALIAQDRVLVRRVRALLERQAVRLGDETGWTLATTPEAAQLMALLRAAQPRASVDELLQWLKSELARGLRERFAGDAADAVDQLEAQCRRLGWVQAGAVQPAHLKGPAAALWQDAQELIAILRAGPAQRSLETWLRQLRHLLDRLGALAWLGEQAAGRQLLLALWLQREPWPDSAHQLALQSTQLGSADFVQWVNETLEAQQFVPELPSDLQVLVTPMARAMLRPFAAIVLPGADAQTLGQVPPGPVLLPDALARQLGMPDQAARRAQLAAGFVQLLRVPHLTLLRCDRAGSEPLARSPLLERLEAAREQAGAGPIPAWQDPRPRRTLSARPVHRAQASAAGQLPRALSASALESLRNCPYQFFGLQLLGLREDEELTEELDKRDYGNWLHAVLHRFHEQARAHRPADPAQALAEAAETERQRMGLSEAEFLPYLASFRRLLPRYLAWLEAHEAAGWQYEGGEDPRHCHPWTHPTLRDLRLQGRLDRHDVQTGRRLLLDYKTGSTEALKDKLKRPLEDTQLAVYALLCEDEADQSGTALEAAYLMLDDSKGLQLLSHPEVQHSAEQLRLGLEQDLASVQAGAPMPALGEGRACALCPVRGLCRKDDWWEGSL